MTLVKLNMYLMTPLPYELDKDPDSTESKRRYLDGDSLTLADCNLLPKLHIVKVGSKTYLRTKSSRECPISQSWNLCLPPQVVCKEYRDFSIPAELKGLTRYLEYAYKEDVFHHTCPVDSEILEAYSAVAKYLTK